MHTLSILLCFPRTLLCPLSGMLPSAQGLPQADVPMPVEMQLTKQSRFGLVAWCLVPTWDDNAEHMSISLSGLEVCMLSCSKKSSPALSQQRRLCAAQPRVPGSLALVTGRRQWSCPSNLITGGEAEAWRCRISTHHDNSQQSSARYSYLYSWSEI